MVRTLGELREYIELQHSDSHNPEVYDFALSKLVDLVPGELERLAQVEGAAPLDVLYEAIQALTGAASSRDRGNVE